MLRVLIFREERPSWKAIAKKLLQKFQEYEKRGYDIYGDIKYFPADFFNNFHFLAVHLRPAATYNARAYEYLY